MDLGRHGVLEKYGVEMIGANADVIDKAEEPRPFKAAMEKIGLEVCRGEDRPHGRSRPASGSTQIGLPCVVRPSFTMGGSGSAIAYNRDEFDAARAPRPRSVAGHRSADRRIDHRLERIRNGGDARRGRQRRDHLLDREL